MMLKQIIQFKCVVILYDQDFGAFCRERDLEEKKRFGEQSGATKPLGEEALEALVEVEMVVGVVAWVPWAVVAMLKDVGWLEALQSLLGWLWWHWVFWLWRVDVQSNLAPAWSHWPSSF